MIITDYTQEYDKIFGLEGLKLFTFNPGKLLYGSYEISVIRLIYTKSYDHPWKLWSSDVPRSNRDTVGPEKDHDWGVKIKAVQKNQDSTGMIIKKDGKVVMATNKLFEEELNQDCRIYLVDHKIVLTYNSRISNTLCMLTRNLLINDKKIKLSREKYMDPSRINRIEKNWVYWDKYICYSVNGVHRLLNSDTEIRVPIPIIKKIRKFYGERNIYFSLSCPPISYGDQVLGVGHIKVRTDANYKESQLKRFIRQQNRIKREYRQYGYMYFMFFYTYDPNTFQVAKLSHALIPERNHKPYTLVFPISLICDSNKYMISYGEGDCRAKELNLTPEQLEAQLTPIKKHRPKRYKFIFI